jgi:hypothetical protein
MKQYFVVMTALLISALLVSVVVYLLVAWLGSPLPVSETELVPQVANSTATTTTSTEELVPIPTVATVATTTEALNETMYAPIPLSDIPLTPAQTMTLEVAGIDPATYEITTTTQACVVEKLGAERVRELISGDTPSVTELWSLQGCL